jgi:hypothetical protein
MPGSSPELAPSEVTEIPQVSARFVRQHLPPFVTAVEGTLQVACVEETYPEVPQSDVADIPQVSTRTVQQQFPPVVTAVWALIRSLVWKRCVPTGLPRTSLKCRR